MGILNYWNSIDSSLVQNQEKARAGSCTLPRSTKLSVEYAKVSPSLPFWAKAQRSKICGKILITLNRLPGKLIYLLLHQRDHPRLLTYLGLPPFGWLFCWARGGV